MFPVPDWVPPLRPRPRDAHKGRMGKLLIIGASPGLTGAVVLAAEAALRSGVGMVTCAVPASLNLVIETKTTEAMSLPLPDANDGVLTPASLSDLVDRIDDFDSIVLGPGLGRAQKTTAFIRSLMPRIACPHVVDADALWHYAQLRDNLTAGAEQRVFTPHEGEMKRLLDSLDLTPRSREENTEQFCDRVPGTLVMKGPGTLVSDAEKLQVIPTGNPGMATGGTGDVLAGIIGAFLARGDRAYDAALRGAYLHGRAGDLGAEAIGEESLIPSDLIDALPMAIQELQQAQEN